MADLTLQEVRSKYPQYKDMSDQQLVEGLHKKYYSDMPIEEFQKKVGYSPVKPQQKMQPQQPQMQPQGRMPLKLETDPRIWSREGPDISKRAYELGGDVTSLLAGQGVSPTPAATAGYLTNVGLQAIPSVVGGIPAKAAAPYLRSTAEGLMRSSLKPILKDLKSGNAVKAINTMLDEGVSATKGGIDKLRDKIDLLNDQISETLKSSKANIQIKRVGKALQEKLNDVKMQVDPEADMDKVKKTWERFIRHPLFGGKEEIPVQLAQELKQGTYAQVGKKYGEMGSADIEAQKALARGLKEAIAEQEPAIAKFNAEESKLINAMNVAERRVLMDANKNPMGLSLLAKNPKAWAAFMMDRSAPFKSMMARILNAGKEQIPAATARIGIGGYQAATQYNPDNEIPPKP